MVVLADEVLESFFESDLSHSFQLIPVADYKAERESRAGLMGSLKSLVLSDNNRSTFNKVNYIVFIFFLPLITGRS